MTTSELLGLNLLSHGSENNVNSEIRKSGVNGDEDEDKGRALVAYANL